MKISAGSWQASLDRALSQGRSDHIPLRLAIVGIGNELNGDDAAGVVLVRKLARHFTKTPAIKIFEAGQALENITGSLIHFRPDAILFIDALSIGGTPGSIHILDWQQSQGFSASTHSLPLGMVVQYLLHEHPCRIYLVGMQVLETTTGAPLTAPVKRAIRSLSQYLKMRLLVSAC